ncbi:MAG: replication restart helicase PriA [Candidatus Nitrospinota bacterium M3_3B_026]
MDYKRKEHPFVEVIIPAPVRGLFTYSAPERMRNEAEPGRRVVAPFGSRKLVGLIVRRAAKADVETKPILQVIDNEPVAPPEILDLALWTAGHYFAAPGEVLPLITPRGDVQIDTVVRIRPGLEARSASRKAGMVRAALEKKGGARRLKLLAADLSMTPGALKKYLSGKAARALFELTQEARSVSLREKQEQRESPTPQASPVGLTTRQREAVDRILPRVRDGSFRTCLIHGVTGSGKTEVYITLAQRALELGKSVLVLAPEIALCEALAARFAKRLGRAPAVLHSGLTPRERERRWYEIKTGAARLVVGARSAVFAPLVNLGLIVVDEEHDTSYKQDSAPRYNGRDVAIKRGAALGVPVVLGSATPSLESYHHAVTGKYELIELPERIDKRPMPVVEMVRPEEPGRLTPRLAGQIKARLEAGEQTLLFINRRGSARFIQCSRCGRAFECRNCSLSLVAHAGAKSLKCHTCGYAEPAPDVCPDCGSDRLFMAGAGSEKVERHVVEMFPGARVARMDKDTTSGRLSSSAILSGVESGKVDILVGTQMITKGHDFPNITLVGAVNADETLRLPDFRSAERSFQLITQAAGRAGRGERPGLVIAQTLSADHHSMSAAARHDFKTFYKNEIPLREAAGYPPFCRMAFVRIDATTKRRGEEFLKRAGPMLAAAAARVEGVMILGPVEALVFKTRNRYHWRALLKAGGHPALSKTLNAFLSELESLKPAERLGVKVAVDMDPASSM